MKIARALVLMLCFAFPMALCAASPSGSGQEALQRAEKSYQLANAAYEKTDYPKAADLYRRAIDEGVADSRLYFNYANTLYRLNQLGMAVLYFEKARKLDPNDQDVAYNLRFLNAQLVDKNPVPETNALTRVLTFLHHAFSINEGLWTVLGLFTILFLAAMAALYAGTALRGVLYATMGMSVLALLAIAPSLAFKIREQETLQYGIVLKSAVEMYSGPGESFQLLTKVHEGTKFEIVETRGEWVSVKLMNGKGGFVRLADLGKV